jgi:hypothetical protein
VLGVVDAAAKSFVVLASVDVVACCSHKPVLRLGEQMTMNRRDFLKVAGAGSLAVVAFSNYRQVASPATVAVRTRNVTARLGGKLFKGTLDGRILASEDGGGSWASCAKFGGQHRIDSLTVRGSQLRAEIGIPGATFQLTSGNGRVWHTVS